MTLENLRVFNLMQPNFHAMHAAGYLDVSNVDFKTMLRGDVALNKKTEMRKDGRPEKALYYHEGALIAVIEFGFIIDDDGFIIERKKTLSYTDMDGSQSPQILIKYWEYDEDNTHDEYYREQEFRQAIEYRMSV